MSIFSGSVFGGGGSSVPSPWVEVESITITGNPSAVDIELSGDYDIYKLEIQDLQRQTGQDGNLSLRLSTDGGETFATGASDYKWTSRSSNVNSTTATAPRSLGNNLLTFVVSLLGGPANSFNGTITIDNPKSSTQSKQISWSGSFIGTINYLINTVGTGQFSNNDPINYVRILTGNTDVFPAGKIKLLGMRL